ncbi:MAG: helix-hairpin-helix domain-containing protein [Blautia sp.]|nr:helix-hairpin-helix domain-containing protein [Blautia sp.]
MIKRLTRGIFLFFLILMTTACTGREDIVLEPAGSGSGGAPVTENGTGTEEESLSGTDAGSAPEEGRTEAAPENVMPPDICVHICGAVENPGVYLLPAGSRVYEGVAAAGGFREDACEDFINQAGILQDGQRLAIPTVEEAEADSSYQSLWKESEEAYPAENTNNAGSVDGLVNINTASEKDLSAIPGIGAGKAAAIVQYRRENGNFASIEDIMKVSGIKEGTFEKIKDRITVN